MTSTVALKLSQSTKPQKGNLRSLYFPSSGAGRMRGRQAAGGAHGVKGAWLSPSPQISTISRTVVQGLTGSKRPTAPGYAQCFMGLEYNNRLYRKEDLQVKVLMTYSPGVIQLN